MTGRGWLAVFLAALAAERILELALSARNARRVRARGAIESGAGHYPWIVALHALWPFALALEVLVLGARPPALWPAAFAGLVVAQVLRWAAIAGLGDRWNTRILFVPGEPPVRTGIYRWMRHPNYVGVILELLAAPLMFGAWRTALAATIVNAILLPIRIGAEERALAGTPSERSDREAWQGR